MKTKSKSVFSVGMIAASLCLAVSAHAFSELPADKYPAAITNLKANGMLPVKQFDTKLGLRGWVLKETRANEHTMVFTPENGSDIVIAGMLIDASGKNLTPVFAAEHLPKPDYSPAFDAFAPKGEAVGVVIGSAKAKAEVTVLFDANCGYCKLMHRLLQPSIDAGDLRVNYVPVAILGSDSPAKGAGLLASKDAKAALEAAATGRAETSTDTALLTQVAKNTELMQKHGFNGTPVVLYKSTKGDLMVANGLPNLSGFFAALGIDGKMDKLKSDPALRQYVR